MRRKAPQTGAASPRPHERAAQHEAALAPDPAPTPNADPAPDAVRAYVTRLVDDYADMILRLCCARLGSVADAQDVCQTVLLKLLEASEGGIVQFRSAEHEKAWIIRTTLNACTDERRRSWRRRVVSLDDPQLAENRQASTSPSADPADDVAEKLDGPDPAVLAVLERLSPAQRQAVYLRYHEGYTTREIAELTGEREATVRMHLSRARARLRGLLKGGAR